MPKKTPEATTTPAVQRGLATYLQPHEQDPEGKLTVLVPLDRIDGQITVKNSRKQGVDLQSFCDSIRSEGLLQPIVVRATEGGRYELVAGRHRVLAHKMLGLATIPAIVRKDMSVAGGHIAAAIENLQRANIDPYEEGATYAAALAADPKLTRKALAERVGVSASTVTVRLRLHSLGPKIGPWSSTNLDQEDIEVLATLADHPAILEAAFKAIKERSWNVPYVLKQALADQDECCIPTAHPFITRHAKVAGYDAASWVERNTAYRNAVKDLKTIQVGKKYNGFTLCLDVESARVACRAAGERYLANQKASTTKAVEKAGKPKPADIKAESHDQRIRDMYKRRARRIATDLVIKHLPARISTPDDVELEALCHRASGLNFYSKQDTEAREAILTAIYGGPYAHLQKDDDEYDEIHALIRTLWKSGEKDKARNVVLGLRALQDMGSTWGTGAPGLPDEEICELVTGKPFGELRDQITKELQDEAKAAAERAKEKAAKASPKKAKAKGASKKKAAKAAPKPADAAPADAQRPGAAVGKECPECKTIVAKKGRGKTARLVCFCTPEEGVPVA